MFVCVTERAWTSFYRTCSGDVISHFTSPVPARHSLARRLSIPWTSQTTPLTWSCIYMQVVRMRTRARKKRTHLGTHVHNYPHVLLYTHNYLQIFPPIYWQIYANREKILVFKWNSLIVKKISIPGIKAVASLLSNIDFY